MLINRKKFTIFGLLLLISALALSVPALASAAAPEYTVTSTADEPDKALGDEVCETAAGDCTLRAAIEESNKQEGIDEINFDPGVFNGQAADTIVLTSALPNITTPEVIINGESSGSCASLLAANGPCVGVVGPAAGTTFELKANGDAVEGLALSGAQVGVNLPEAQG